MSKFYISGVQLGKLIAFAEVGEAEKVEELVEKVIDNQRIPYAKFKELELEMGKNNDASEEEEDEEGTFDTDELLSEDNE